MNRKQRRADAKAGNGANPVGELLNAALQHHQNGRLEEAASLYSQILEADPRHADANHLLGVIAFQLGRNELAVDLIGIAIAANRSNPAFHSNLGNALNGMGRPDDALAAYDTALRLRPDYADAHSNRGSILEVMGRLDEALTACDRALRLRPDYADAHYNRGNILREMKRLDDAMAAYDRALKLQPDYLKAHNNRGKTLLTLKRYEEALSCFNKALSIDLEFAAAHNNRAVALIALRRFEEALVDCEIAFSLNPDLPETYLCFGNALVGLDRQLEAVPYYGKAIELKPDFAAALYGRADALKFLKRTTEALADLKEAFSLDPDLDDLHGAYVSAKISEFDWSQIDTELAGFEEAIRASGRIVNPWTALSILDAPDLHWKIAGEYAREKFPVSGDASRFKPKVGGEKIRLGFFSSDFRTHPVSQLIVELIETIDRDRFALVGFAFGPEAQDEMAKRISSAFDELIDVRRLSDKEVSQKSREMGIDIAVDLNGYTGHSRTSIFADRCAPVQVNYLGYPGTMAAEFMDYIIADEVVIPPRLQSFYSEKIAYLPETFLPIDSKTEISSTIISRREMELPENATVFCCFNSNYKINPAIFDIWMRVLREAEGSVLWLRQLPELARANLEQEARKRGVDSGRIIFAKPIPFDEHLARHRLADVFLDTFPYNAHTTASDALRAGLPVLTYSGKSFASRVAASLLNAVGLPELVTESEAQYEAAALRFALDPEHRDSIRQKLAANLAQAPLFNTARMARHVEAAFEAMHRIQLSGSLPQNIKIEAIEDQ